jgi:hypothetical protein
MKTLKCVILLASMAGIGIGSALGQTILSGCSQCVCVADGSCDSDNSSCNGGDYGCEVKVFTASCSGSYKLSYSLDCSGSTCAACFACVYLRDSVGSLIASSICHSSCSSGDCIDSCATSVTLTQNAEYKLYVCKRICFGGSCDSCTTCVARGYVWKSWANCGTIAACNP